MTAPVSVAFDDSGARASFTLFHPKGNSLTAEMVDALAAALDTLAENPHLKLVTIAGAGRDFSFGASVPEHLPDRIGTVLPAMHRLIEDLLELPAVTAAIVSGRCLGGGFELALACDFIFAAEDAMLGLPEVVLGVFPPAGSVLLPARAGTARATRAIITGEPFTAAAWRDAGLVEACVPADRLPAAIDEWYHRHLAGKSAAALRHAAAAARATLLAQVRATLPRLEALYLDDLMRTHDAVEGVSAFLEKRVPRWTDR